MKFETYRAGSSRFLEFNSSPCRLTLGFHPWVFEVGAGLWHGNPRLALGCASLVVTVRFR